MIIEKIIEHKRSKIRNYPVHANRASEAGHPCLKYLVFNRTRWEEKALPDVSLQFVFDEGNIHEAAFLRELSESGVKVMEQQRPFSWPKFELTGSIDAKVSLNGERPIPLEFKTMSPFVFNSINSSEDLIHGKYVYLRKYPAQMSLYMLMDSIDKGLMVCKNKVNGQLKEIPFTLDYEYAEGILKRLEAVNYHVKAGTVPEQEWMDDVCPDCPYLHISFPDRKGTELQMIDDPELAAKLDRWEILKASVSEYKSLDEEIKEAIKGKEKISVGNFLITGKWVDNKGGVREIKPYRYWLPKIQKL